MADIFQIGGTTNTVPVVAGTNTTVNTRYPFTERKPELTKKIREQNEKFMEQENERFRKENAKKLGLPESATWEDIDKENEKRRSEGKIQITVPRWA